MEHAWTVLATKALVDNRTNMMSIIDVSDVLLTPEFGSPVFNPKSTEDIAIDGLTLQLASLWTRSDYSKPEKGIMRYVLLTPDGKRYPQPDREMDLTKSVTGRFVLIVDKLIFRGYGLYYFLTEQKKEGQKRWSRVAKVPLLFRTEQPAQTTERGEKNKKQMKKKGRTRNG